MKHFLLFSFLVTSLFCFGQADSTSYVDPNYQAKKSKAPKQKQPIGDRMYYGGTFGVSFGTNSSSVLVEPLVGFKMTPKLSTGLGVGFRYGSGRNTVSNNTFTYTNYLGRVFARYVIIPKIYAHVEYMVESYDEIFYFESLGPNNSGRTDVPFLFVGGGFRSQAGRNGFFIFQVLFNVLQDNELSREVYPSNVPYISIGYISGF